MNTDPANHEQRASDYLDDQLDDAARRAVDADAVTQGLVAAMREVRTELAAVPVPTADARERAIAAAMNAFDETAEPAAAATAPMPPARTGRSPRPTSRWLMPAAAAVVVALAGGLLATVVGDNDDDTARPQSADAEDAVEGASERSAAAAATDAGDESFDAAETIQAAEAGDAATATAAASEATSVELAAAEAAGDAAAPATALVTLRTDQDVIALVEQADAAVPAVAACAPADIVGAARDQRVAPPRDVLIARDAAANEAVVLDAATCAELDRVALP